MTKICMLSTGHDPLDDRIYYKEVLTLAKRYKPIVMVMPGEPSDFNIPQAGITFVPLRRHSSLLARFLVIPQAVLAIIKIHPQICHFHDYELIFAIPFIRLLSKCKIIYDVHEVYPEMVLGSKKVPRLLRPFLAKLVCFFENTLSRMADHIITSDESISEQFNHKKTEVSTIFNYPRLSLFVPNKKDLSQLKEKYRKKDPIIYAGGMNEERGFFHMIEAMKIIKEKRPDVVLLLLGELTESLKKQANTLIKEKSLEQNVELLGWVPHNKVVNYLSVSKVGLVPFFPTKKYMKNISIKQFEYMACGLPILGADLPPITSYITASGCGTVFDSTKIEALAAGVLSLLKDDSEWKRMAVAGKKAVAEKWNWAEMEKKLYSVYDTLLETTNPEIKQPFL